AELILVGLDVVERHRHGRFQPPRGELDGAVPKGRRKHKRKQASHQEAKRPEHKPFDHRNQRSRFWREAPSTAALRARLKGKAGTQWGSVRKKRVPRVFFNDKKKRVSGGVCGFF